MRRLSLTHTQIMSNIKIFRLAGSTGPRLGLEIEGERFDLSAAVSHLSDISAWLSSSDPVKAVQDSLPHVRKFPLNSKHPLLAPVDLQEVWASGVTYLRSKV